MLIFLQTNADISQIKEVLVLKGIFYETTCVYLHKNFQVSSRFIRAWGGGVIILTLSHHPIPKRTPKKATLIRINLLENFRLVLPKKNLLIKKRVNVNADQSNFLANKTVRLVLGLYV